MHQAPLPRLAQVGLGGIVVVEAVPIQLGAVRELDAPGL